MSTNSSQASSAPKSGRYYYGLGRRKQAVAKARIYKNGKGSIIINGKDIKNYINYSALEKYIREPLQASEMVEDLDITILVSGGGFRGQVDAIKLAIAKALLRYDKDLRGTLKPLGLLSTDSRVKERKKYGLKKARKAPQYTKR